MPLEPRIELIKACWMHRPNGPRRKRLVWPISILNWPKRRGRRGTLCSRFAPSSLSCAITLKKESCRKATLPVP